LKTIRIPSNVEFIGKKCFCECRSFWEIAFEYGAKVWRLDKGVVEPWNNTIPGPVGFIEEFCFEKCRLKCIKLAKGIKPDCDVPDDCRIEYYEEG
jgi:hypothetical protein